MSSEKRQCQSFPKIFLKNPTWWSNDKTIIELSYCKIMWFIILCNCFFLFIGREPTTWPANYYLQIMVCSCAMSLNCLAANTILLMRKWNHACSLFVYVISVITPGRQRALTAFRRYYLTKNKLSDQMIKQLLNSVFAKYRDLSVSRRSIICLSLQLWQIIDLLATDNSRYFAQPRPIIANCQWRTDQLFAEAEGWQITIFLLNLIQ